MKKIAHWVANRLRKTATHEDLELLRRREIQRWKLEMVREAARLEARANLEALQREVEARVARRVREIYEI